MKKNKLTVIIAMLCSSTIVIAQHSNIHVDSIWNAHHLMVVHNPNEAMTELKHGNQRFVSNHLINTDYPQQIAHTKTDQHPYAVVLSCLDSRIPPEIVFDQGIGNIFVARVAGNIEDTDIVGSLEFATKIKGSKLIVVMGHNNCGAIKGAIDNVNMGSLTTIVNHIKPAITGNKQHPQQMLDETAKSNVRKTIADILHLSPIISQLVKEGTVKITGAFYNITNGTVQFFE